MGQDPPPTEEERNSWNDPETLPLLPLIFAIVCLVGGVVMAVMGASQ